MPLVLVQNEVTVGEKYQWKDDVGVLYHFPNKYKNLVKEGTLFIYYRGVRRAGNARGSAEYFGFGRIGQKWVDTESLGERQVSRPAWYCEITDYIPFVNPVPIKINDKYFEDIPKNIWGVGVRQISQKTYDEILAAAGVHGLDGHASSPIKKIITEIDQVNPEIIPQGETLVESINSSVDNVIADSLVYQNSPRYSKYSKLYGDRAEEVVFKMLGERGVDKLCWIAREGRKPGWDIEYYDQKSEVAVEVKGTSGKRFRNVEITAGEWKAAEQKRNNYHLYLVADCLGVRPLVQVITDPFELFLHKKITLTPTGYRATFNL